MKQLRYLVYLLFVLGVTACDSNDDPDPSGLTAFQLESINYFNEVALGFEFGSYREITRKWITPMNVYVWGEPTSTNLSELTVIINEINDLVTDGFEIVQVTDSLDANYYIYFGNAAGYVSAYPEAASYTNNNWGLFTIYFNQRAELYAGHMYVDIYRADQTAQRHLLREELTQSIGLAKDSPRYPNSIFQSSWTTTTTYADIDRELIRLLYHPNMVVGLEDPGTTAIINKIYQEENTN